MNAASPYLEQLSREPSRAAVVEPGGRVVDRATLARRIAAIAEDLRDVVPGERLLLQVGPGATQAAATLAAVAVGAVPVLLEPGKGDAVYEAQVRAAEARWVVVDRALVSVGRAPGARALLRRAGIDAPAVPSGLRRVVVSAGALDRRTAALRIVPRSVDDEGAIVFTGGTTKAPKGVVHSHGSLERFLGAVAQVTEGLSTEDLVADTLPQVLYALRLGKTAWLTKGRGRKRAEQVLALVRSGKVDSYFGAPWLWRELRALAGGATLPATLRTVLLGSAPVTRTFLEDLRSFLHPETRVLALYGLSEAGPVCVATVEEKLAWTDGDLVGAPIPGMSVETDAGDGDGIGEVLVRGPSLYAGYLGQPRRLPDEPLRTGDLGRVVDVGGRPALILAGRAKDMILRRAVNLYPSLLEPPLLAAARARGLGVEDLALIGVWDEARQDEEVVLCASPASVDESALVGLAAEVWGPDAAPDRALILDALPVTGRQNKLDRNALRALAGPPRSRAVPLAERLRGSVLPYGVRALGRKYTQLARDEGPVPRVVVPLALRLGLWGVSQATWALDEVVAPRWREARGLGPIFVIGHQRSGTTFLHRLLAADASHARALALHEMLLPATSWQGALAKVSALDARAGGPLASVLSRAEDAAFGSLDDLHRLRLGEVEEDEFALWAIYASIMCANDAPTTVAARALDELRHFEEWPPERQARVLGYYRDVLTRKLHRSGGDPAARWIVSKNPAFTQKIPALLATFPDARFVYLVRDPRQAIPSRLSLIQRIWAARFPGFGALSPAQVETLLEDSVRTYLAAERDLPAVPETRRLTIRHADLRADPHGAVERIYAHFRLPSPDAGIEAALSLGEAPAPRRLPLEAFGLDEARLRRELGPVFARYGFV